MSGKNKHRKADKREAAVCGLFCPSCTLFIGTHEDPRRLEVMAAAFNQPVESLKCDGCRAERRNMFCSSCKLVQCASGKGLDFCGQCSEYPCDELKAFQSILPHRLELWQSIERIKKAGWEQWCGEMVDHYSCPECGTINSAYDKACRKCGATPSCEYVKVNKEGIIQRWPGRQ
jgi:predicted RNA-binding Zn-ribbon protein involved in translation (DUF1610 family)